MCKAIRLLIYTFVVMTVVFTSIPTQHCSDGVAYAQGAFGRRATGSADNSDNSNQAAEDAKKREEEARKAAEEKRRQEEEARQAEIRRREDEDRRAAEQKRQEETRRREQEARDAEVRRQQEARDAEIRRQQAERDAENRRQQEARDAENRRREQEARDAENRRRDQEARDAEARDSAARRDREEAARQAELRRRQDEERRVNEESRVAAARRADEERRRAEEVARRTADATPTYRNDNRRSDTKKYDRVGERPRPPKDYYHDYYHDYYPYDSNYTIIDTGGAPVIIYPSYTSPSTYWDQSSVVIVDDYPVTVIPSIYTVTPSENPIPRDADEALILLRRCWIEKSPGLMWWLLPHNDYIDIVENGIVTSRMKANDFYSLTFDAVNSMDTEIFWFRTVQRVGEYVVASGIHSYRGTDGIVRRCDMTYTLARRGGRWVIVQTGFGPIVTGSVVYRGLTPQESRLIFMKLSPMAIFSGFPNRAISLGALCAIPFF